MFSINRRVATILISLPLAYTMIFGALFSPNVITGVPIIVCNLDTGALSRQLIHSLVDTPELDVIDVSGTALDADRRMLELHASGAVIIPNDFTRRLNTANPATVELVIDNTNRTLGGTAAKEVQTVVATLNAQLVAAQLHSTATLSMSSRVLFNPTSGYEDFFLAALILHSAQIAVVFSIAPAVVEAKRSITRPLRFFASRLLIYSTLELATVAICLALGLSVFDIKCAGNPTEILMLAAAFIICMTAFALAVGAWIKVAFEALLTPLVYVMPSILFAGVTWPRHSMDDFSLLLSYVMPIGYAAEDLRSMLVKGAAIDWQTHATALLMLAALFSIIALIGLIKHVGDSKTRSALAHA